MKNALVRVYKWEYFWLCLILIATLAMHFSIILSPNQLVLDEQHYVKDARVIISDHTDQRPEHPPLAKLFIVGGMKVFGDNQYGWRVPSVIMGTVCIILFFLICRKLNLSRRAVNIATFLFAFENFVFMLSSVAMLDVFMLTFILAFFLLYLYKEYILSGVFIGVAAVAKMFSVFATPTIFIHWVFSRERRSIGFLATVLLAPVSFLALLTLFDFAIYQTFHNPINHIKDMLSLMSSLTFANTTHPALSRPWEWLLSYNPMAFWFGPYKGAIGPIPDTTWIGGYTGAISPNIWLAMIPVVLFMLYRAIKNRSDAGLFGVAWFFGTFILWIPYSILTNRISFIFYLYPSIGALCLGLGMGFDELLDWVKTKTSKIKIPVFTGISAFFTVHIVSVVILTPLVLFLLDKSI